MDLKIEALSPYAKVPARAHDTDSGLDLFYCGRNSSDKEDRDYYLNIAAKDRALLPTGIAIELPLPTKLLPGISIVYEAQIRSKSGLAISTGLMVLNSPATIDSSFRGMLQVILYNSSNSVVTVVHGAKIAQLVICPIIIPDLILVDKVNTNTLRGTSGFGSTGEF